VSEKVSVRAARKRAPQLRARRDRSEVWMDPRITSSLLIPAKRRTSEHSRKSRLGAARAVLQRDQKNTRQRGPNR